jgi:hypothetical protein
MASPKDLIDIDDAWQKVLRYAGFHNGGPKLTSLIEIEGVEESTAYYVDVALGNDNNPGTPGFPFKTLQRALDALPSTLNYDVDIYVDGIITESIRMPPFVPLLGTLNIIGGTIPDFVPRTTPWREFLYRTSAPTDGYHNEGSVTFDTSGVNGLWVCTASGTPGTWTQISGGGGGGISTLNPIGSSPNANAATISGSTLTLQPASASFGGVVTTGTQSLAGDKNFTGTVTVPTLVIGSNKIMYASSAPVSGAYTQGDIVYNTAPTSGGSVGWSCVSSGAPGVWREFGLISAS